MICRYPVSPLRTEAADDSEICSQLFFGETVSIIETKAQWLKVRGHHDNYEGWIDKKFLVPIAEMEMHEWHANSKVLFNDYFQINSNYGKISLTKGARIPIKNQATFQFAKGEYDLLGFTQTVPNESTEIALSYLNAPYLWGGRSAFGLDCSGLTQMVFQFQGLQLKRDACMQVEQGKAVKFENRLAGDVPFFENANGKITHVGILLNPNEIIHAHGCVRIDDFDEKGIKNREQDEYSHKFHSIRRY